MVEPERLRSTEPEAQADRAFTDEQLVRSLERRVANSVETAVRTAMRTAFLGPLPFIALVVVGWTNSLREWHMVQGTIAHRIIPLLIVLAVIVATGFCYAVFVGVVAGRLAHRIAFETTMSVSRLAMALAWVVNLTVWGWCLVLAWRS